MRVESGSGCGQRCRSRQDGAKWGRMRRHTDNQVEAVPRSQRRLDRLTLGPPSCWCSQPSAAACTCVGQPPACHCACHCACRCVCHCARNCKLCTGRGSLQSAPRNRLDSLLSTSREQLADTEQTGAHLSAAPMVMGGLSSWQPAWLFTVPSQSVAACRRQNPGA